MKSIPSEMPRSSSSSKEARSRPSRQEVGPAVTSLVAKSEPGSKDRRGPLALQQLIGNRAVCQLLAQGSAHLDSGLVQRRSLNQKEREDLSDAKNRLARLREQYEKQKTLLADALVTRGGYGDVLGYFQNLNWDHATKEVTKLDEDFKTLGELATRAGVNGKACSEYISKVNMYDKSGGMNRFNNIFANVERSLLSRERNGGAQFTALDEVYFRRYLSAAKAPLTVFRGDGRDVSPDTFHSVPFSNMPAGGTPDITFAGVVEHT